MSVSNVTGVNGVARIVLPANATRPSDPAADKPSEPPTAQSMSAVVAVPSEPEPTAEPASLRYPWLSRLARELEPASPQPSPYGRVDLLGERLDKQA